MSSESLRLLEQLRHAIQNSLSSVEILEVLSALTASGHRVSVSIDATIDEPDPFVESPDRSVRRLESELLTQSDERFLRAMHISLESELHNLHKAN
jgi:hypothetical protein